MTRDRALVLIVIALLVAAALRLPNLTEVPPGLHHDEAANGLQTAGIARQGQVPFYVSTPAGKEPLYFYLAAGLFALLGKGVFALRLTSALLGVLTVAATYWVGRELLADRRIALIAAVLLAVSFWHLLLSRVGFRAIGLPLVQALAVAALFRGLKRDAPLWLALGGAFLGLAVYTYFAAWFLLLTLGLALFPLLAVPEQGTRRFIQLTLVFAAALLVIAPFFLFLYRHIDSVQPALLLPAVGSATLLERTLRAFGLIFLVGDPSWRFNLPGRPLFNWFWGGLLLAGWLISLWRWRRWWYDWQKAAIRLLLLAPFFMLLPLLLTADAADPPHLAAVGLIPFIFFLPALGLVTLVEQLADRFRGRDDAGAHFLRALTLLEQYDVNYTFIVLFILLLGSTVTAQQYFQTWAASDQLFEAADGDLALLAAALDSVEADNLYVAATPDRLPVVRFLSGRSEQVKWLPGDRALALSPGTDALYLYPLSTPRPAWAASYLEEAPEVGYPRGPDGRPAFTAYTPLGAATRLNNQLQAAPANFGNIVHLSAYTVEAGVAGETIPLLLSWQALGRPAAATHPIVDLYDNWGNRWSWGEGDAYPASQWVPGETIVQQVNLSLPPGTPPGSYRAHVGFVDPQTSRRLPYFDEEARYAGDSLPLTEVTVTAGEPPATLPEVPSGTPKTVHAGLSLLGYDQGQAPIFPGEVLPLALWWYARTPQPPLTVRLALARADNTGIILLDTRPVHDTYPFPQWSTPQFLIDQIDPRIPPDLEPGDYRLELGVFDEMEGRIFATTLAPVVVVAGEHAFTLPPLSHPLSAIFAGEIELAGYNLEQVAADSYTLTLFWQALERPASNYTVFVHLLSRDRTCCVWETERMPHSPSLSATLEGVYPTGQWRSGEVIVERYSVKLPPKTLPGSYPLAVGLSLPESGQRLRVVVPDLPASDLVYLRSLQVEP